MIAAGAVVVPDATAAGFIYVDPITHAVTAGSSLPNNAVPMATFTSAAGVVSVLNDAREQVENNLVWGITSDIQAQTSQATGSSGSLEKYARADHVHPMNVNLIKAGTIPGASFSGNPKSFTVAFAFRLVAPSGFQVNQRRFIQSNSLD